MEILNPSPPPSPSIERFIMVGGHSRIVGSTGGSPSSAAGRIHVAVGRSPEKTLGLLRWAFRRFGCTEVVLVHVHQPSLVIPTLLGKIPVNQATEEVVKSHRRSEKEETKKILSSYMNYCHKSKVRATIIVTESDQIQNGIVYLINSHAIRQLVMGSAPDNCFRLKGGSSKATFMAKYTPPFCEIWFVSKGRHIWTREASSDYNPHDIMLRKRSRFSLDSSSTESECDNGETEQPRREHVDQVHLEFCKSNVSDNSSNNSDETLFLSGSPPSWPDSPVDHKLSSKLFSKGFVSDNLNEIMVDAEKSRTTAFSDLVKRKKIENQISEILKRVQASEDARACETKLREERDSHLKETKEHHQNILNEKEKALKELESKMTKLSFLELRGQDLLLRHEETNAELDALQSSIEYLQLERTKHSPTGGGVKELRRFSGRHIRVPNYKFLGLGENNNHNFKEFSSSDIQAATCNFSESFKLGQGGNGCVYKGEIMNRSVVIKKLHPHNGHGSIEFQQEVFVLSKLTHPHLVTLYGACPESLCIVYEYLPNGTLQERLFLKRANSPSLTWRTRCRLVYEIASALLFLHSSKPDKIVHGDLKPDNILLDSELRCKICDFGISRLVPEDRDKSEFMVFRRNTGPRGSFPYTDPELLQGGHEARNPKCDVYSFGIIILQLLTGKPPLGLANEVRRVVSNGQVAAVLDGEWPADVARKLVEFGLRCCEMNGRDRPDLTPEIVRELGQLHLMKERHVPSFFLCPILQDIMHDPQVAADGFTYEGRALRDWLENGRETSPMTNLKLEHLNLTPNHALRFAIQDWLCQS